MTAKTIYKSSHKSHRTATDGTVLWGVGKHRQTQMRDLSIDYMTWFVNNTTPNSTQLKKIERELKRREDVDSGKITNDILNYVDPCDTHPRIINWNQNNNGCPSLCCGICKNKQSKPKFVRWMKLPDLIYNWADYTHWGSNIPDQQTIINMIQRRQLDALVRRV